MAIAVLKKGKLYETNRDLHSRNGTDGFGGCSGPADGPGFRGSTATGFGGTSGHDSSAGSGSRCGSRRIARRRSYYGGIWPRICGHFCGRQLQLYSQSLKPIFTSQAVNQAAPRGLLFFRSPWASCRADAQTVPFQLVSPSPGGPRIDCNPAIQDRWFAQNSWNGTCGEIGGTIHTLDGVNSRMPRVFRTSLKPKADLAIRRTGNVAHR